jgi:diguanylate cyclase (GGDEF)-like protein
MLFASTCPQKYPISLLARLALSASRLAVMRSPSCQWSHARAIAQITLSHNSQLLGSLTASFGVASFPQHGATSNAVMQAADAALYRAKAAGRNQVLIAL